MLRFASRGLIGHAYRSRALLGSRPLAASAALSHVRGDTSTPLLDRSIGGFLLDAAERHAESEFVVDLENGVRRTYAEFLTECEAAAAALRRHGYEPGDRLGVWLPNCREWLVTQFACHLAGLVLVNVNPAYRAPELRHALNLVGCKGLVATPRLKASDYAALLSEARSEEGGVPSLLHVFGVAREERFAGADVEFDALLQPPTEGELASLRAVTAVIAPADAANIQFTSGTTGAPKAATLTNRNVLNNGMFVGKALGYGAGDRVCVPVPLYHCFGCVIGALACLTHGAAVVLPSASFDAARTLQAVAEERCTSLYGVPTMFSAMLALAGGYDLGPQLRTGVMAGSPCPPDVMEAVMGTLGMGEVSICCAPRPRTSDLASNQRPPLEHAPRPPHASWPSGGLIYATHCADGMTETSPVSFQTMPGTAAELRCETVGTIHPHVECKVVADDAERSTLPVGGTGELLTRGYSLFSGYYNQPQATAECIDAEGWMHTGDLATIDGRGYCRIVGRKKDMIIRGGENVYPTEVENLVRTHPAVSDVAVVGAPHARLGEEVVAFVIPAAGGWRTVDEAAAQLGAWCRDRISHFKVPARVVLTDELPLTVSGKVMKFELRRRLEGTADRAGAPTTAR